MPLPRTRTTGTADDPAARTCNLSYVQRELGLSRYSEKRMCQYLAQMITGYGFPAPIPTIRKGGQLSTEVHHDSQWWRAAVDAWLDGQLPPAAAEMVDAKAMRAAAEDMDAAARNLKLVGGRDFRGAEA